MGRSPPTPTVSKFLPQWVGLQKKDLVNMNIIKMQ